MIKESGRRTYAILVGRDNAIKTLAASFVLVYLFEYNFFSLLNMNRYRIY